MPPARRSPRRFACSPLKKATLDGIATFGSATAQAWLITAYRPDAGDPTASLRIAKSLAENFPVSAFEGPPGVGGTERLLQVALQDENAGEPQHASGSFQEGLAFKWTFDCPRLKPNAGWRRRPGNENLRAGPGEQIPPLEAVFRLPEDSRPLRGMLDGYPDK